MKIFKARKYKDRALQAAYDGSVEAFAAGWRGWVAPMRHGLWNADGRRARGASALCAFWNGFDGLTLNGGRLMYVPGSIARSCYMAGRDCGRLMGVVDKHWGATYSQVVGSTNNGGRHASKAEPR